MLNPFMMNHFLFIIIILEGYDSWYNKMAIPAAMAVAYGKFAAEVF